MQYALVLAAIIALIIYFFPVLPLRIPVRLVDSPPPA